MDFERYLRVLVVLGITQFALFSKGSAHLIDEMDLGHEEGSSIVGTSGAGAGRDVKTTLQKVEGLMKEAEDLAYPGSEYENQNSVVIMGSSRAGKSTLMNFIAAGETETAGVIRSLVAERLTIEGISRTVINVRNALPISLIGHRTESQTRMILPWVDKKDQSSPVVYWDCPGFGDSGGPLQQIVNAFGVEKLFSLGIKAKLVWVVSAEQLMPPVNAFCNGLREMTAWFIDDARLKRALSIMITKYNSDPDSDDYMDVIERMRVIRDSAEGLLTPRALVLLDFLIANPQKVATFPKPKKLGIYAPFELVESADRSFVPDRDIVMKGINNSEYVEGIQEMTELSIDLHAKEKIRDIASEIEGSFDRNIRSIQSEIGTEIYETISNHKGEIDGLRRALKEKTKELESLPIDARNPELFIARLKEIFPAIDARSVDRSIRYLRFLEKLNKSLEEYSVAKWYAIMQERKKEGLGIIPKLKKLSKPPHISFESGVLNIRGEVFGTSDIMRVFSRRTNGRVRAIYCFAAQLLLFDADIKAHEVSLALVSPVWNLRNVQTKIDLSGEDGTPSYRGDGDAAAEEELGAPGGAGGNGGHFYGEAQQFTNAQDSSQCFIVKTNGGKGGKGQKGGKGKDGSDGTEGTEDLVRSRTAQSLTENGEDSCCCRRRKGKKITFESRGNAAERGYDGKNGGRGGQGGKSGKVKLSGEAQKGIIKEIKVPGKDGENGGAGKGGKGGKNLNAWKGVSFKVEDAEEKKGIIIDGRIEISATLGVAIGSLALFPVGTAVGALAGAMVGSLFCLLYDSYDEYWMKKPFQLAPNPEKADDGKEATGISVVGDAWKQKLIELSSGDFFREVERLKLLPPISILNLKETEVSRGVGAGAERISDASFVTPSNDHSSSLQNLGASDELERVKEISKRDAENKGCMGPRSISGWALQDVPDLGNCFYDAAIDQLRVNRHYYLDSIPEGTLPRDSLRLSIQGIEFKDEEWAEDRTIDEFVKKFPGIILAIVDTRTPENGFTIYFVNESGEIVTYSSADEGAVLPEGRTILRLAATGNHFMSVRSHPDLERGLIRGAWCMGSVASLK